MTHTKTNYQIVTYARRHETGCIPTLSDGVGRHFVGNGAAATRTVEGLHKKGRRDARRLPERYMLAAIGRTDLLA